MDKHSCTLYLFHCFLMPRDVRKYGADPTRRFMTDGHDLYGQLCRPFVLDLVPARLGNEIFLQHARTVFPNACNWTLTHLFLHAFRDCLTWVRITPYHIHDGISIPRFIGGSLQRVSWTTVSIHNVAFAFSSFLGIVRAEKDA